MTWRDVSTFTRDAVNREPRSFELQAGRVKITVTRLIGATGWFVRCPALGWDAVQIPSVDVEDAKHVAMRWVREELLRAARELAHVATEETQPMTAAMS